MNAATAVQKEKARDRKMCMQKCANKMKYQIKQINAKCQQSKGKNNTANAQIKAQYLQLSKCSPKARVMTKIVIC